VRTVVFEAVEILVSLTTCVAPIGLLLLHANRARVRYRSQRVNNGKGSVLVLFELLVLVTMLETISIDVLLQWPC
jgi:hypothetical protein